MSNPIYCPKYTIGSYTGVADVPLALYGSGDSRRIECRYNLSSLDSGSYNKVDLYPGHTATLPCAGKRLMGDVRCIGFYPARAIRLVTRDQVLANDLSISLEYEPSTVRLYDKWEVSPSLGYAYNETRACASDTYYDWPPEIIEAMTISAGSGIIIPATGTGLGPHGNGVYFGNSIDARNYNTLTITGSNLTALNSFGIIKSYGVYWQESLYPENYLAKTKTTFGYSSAVLDISGVTVDTGYLFFGVINTSASVSIYSVRMSK